MIDPASGSHYRPATRIVKSITVTVLAISSVVGGIAAGLRFTRLQYHSEATLNTPAIASVDSRLTYPSQHTGDSPNSIRKNGLQANILELPKASTDFVGYWGGYIQSSIQRLSPDLVGASPDRVSVIFGRQGDTVFMTSELYTSPKQKIVHQPKARIVPARVAIIEYESADKDLYYVSRDRFQLADPSNINYQGTIDIYDLNSHRLMGIVTQTAVLKRLLTVRQQLRFARPGRNQIPRIEVSAREHFGSH
jgi:hypothetical protein